VSRVLRAVAWAAAFLSWGSLARAGAAIGWLTGSVLRIRRAAVDSAMGRAGVTDPSREATAMYAALGTGVMELLWLAGSTPTRREQALRRHVAFDGDLDLALRAACARGPVVLAASHTGNWELVAYGAAQVFAGYDRRLAVVVKEQSVGAFHAFCMNLRQACGLALLAPRGAMAEARRRLASGHVVAMPIDQVPDRARHGLGVTFLGAEAHADRSPFALARAAGATLIVTAGSRDGRTQRIHLLAELPAESQRGVPAGAWVAAATREASAALDTFVRVRPSSWLWLHRRWRAPFELGRRGAVASRDPGAGQGASGAGPLVATGHPG
jgi:lauroyl/myristoyl acyltransferase